MLFVLYSSEVARHIRSDSYALIFGVNTFISLILQTSLTYTIAGHGGLKLSIRHQVSKTCLVSLKNQLES